MTKKRIIVFSGLILIILALSIFCVIMGRDFENKTANEETASIKEVEEKQETIVIDSTNLGDITSVMYQNQYGEFTLNKEESGEWYFDHDIYADVNQYKVSEMLEKVTKISAVKKIESDMSEKENFGLDNPGMVITLKLINGEEKIYNIGILNEAKQGYYLNIQGENDIYFVRVGIYNSFDVKVVELIDKLNFPIVTGENIVQVEIIKNGENYIIDEMSKLETFIGSIAVNDCWEIGVKDEDMTKYGLKPSIADVKVIYKDLDTGEEKNYVLHIGNISEETSEYFVTKGDANNVYTMSIELVERMLKYTK